jgi:hypothetical protein
MDYLPSLGDLKNGLSSWRKEHPSLDIKNVIYPKYCERCKVLNIKRVKYEQFNKMVNGGTDLKYSQTKAMLEALGIEHWPQFLDHCRAPSVKADVIPIGFAHCNKLTIDSVKNSATPIQIHCVPPEYLKGIRTRIDMVDMKAGQSTEFVPFYGHEYVHVIRGQVECKFGDGSPEDPKTFQLVGTEEPGRDPEALFAIAFAASLHHSFKCLTDVRMAVGRSAKSLPKGIKS